MTQSIILAETPGSNSSKSASGQTLRAAIKSHLQTEKASFHTPGHKGRLTLGFEPNLFSADLTELPGLDELANSSGVLLELQNRISNLWQAKSSFISVNGASAALCAAIIACSAEKKDIVLPRNAHRSAINALIICGLNPVWYEPVWNEKWSTWGAVNVESLEKLLDSRNSAPAALLVTSPNYAGFISDIAKLAAICKKRGITLIVDEAHGAHLISASGFPQGALDCGADIVVHSLHKTLSAPTQTGVLHLSKDCLLEPAALQAAINLLQSSSPSYLLMLGIEQALDEVQQLEPVLQLASSLCKKLKKFQQLELLDFENANCRLDPLHLLISHKEISADQFAHALAQKGIFAETVIGKGVLLMLGLGSTEEDIVQLLNAIASLEYSGKSTNESYHSLPACKQTMSPREAFFANSRLIDTKVAATEISCDWVAPCPPGYAVLAPGQRISAEAIEFIKANKVRVVSHPQLEGDSDGPNTAS